MSLELQQNLKLQHKLLITPQLQQAIRILQLSRLELESFLNDQLIENPALEDKEDLLNFSEVDKDNDQKYNYEEIDKVIQKETSLGKALYDSTSYEKNTTAHSSYEKLNQNDFNYEGFLSKKKDLHGHLLDQVSFLYLSKKEKKIALYLIDSIDSNGYLNYDKNFLLEEHFCEKTLECVILKLQKLDPVGVAARSLAECLTIQVKNFGLKNKNLENIIQNHLNDLAKKKYKQIAQNLGISLKEVYKNLDIILSLEAKPGKIFDDLNPQYITPDLYIYKTQDGLEISLERIKNENLGINHYYSNLLEKSKNKKEKEYLKNKIKEAKWLIKSLDQRKKTLLKVMKAILKKQKDFFSYGKEHLKPLVLKDIASDTNLHESTISRITSNKYVHTEQGLFELRSFFNSSLGVKKGGVVSSSVVKILIERIIKEENPRKPFSDSKIKEKLEQKGIDIARRTVAKYREQLGFLASSLRTRHH